MTTPHTFVALLRGVNVGGRSVLPMAELRTLFADLGFERVETYIQSGNVVFDSSVDDPDELAAHIEREIARTFALEPSVLIRTPCDLERIARDSPYLSRATDVSKLHVVFLDRAPSTESAADLDPNRSPPDELALEGRELYLFLPNGAGRTKLTLDYVERVLGVRATQRNWNTLLKLVELSRR